MPIDDDTLNLLGLRADGSMRSDLILKVYASPAGGSFTLIEDDGETMAYRTGAVRETLITQAATGTSWFVSVGAPTGD
jgi:hypothetical protein